MIDTNILSRELVNFIDDLRLAGYNIGIEQFITAQTLLTVLVAQGQLPPTLIQLHTLLAPILCHSPQEQAEFVERFEKWVQQFEIIGEHVTSETIVLSPETQQISRKMQRWHWVAGVTLLVIFTVLTVFFVFPPTTPEPQLPPAAPTQPDKPKTGTLPQENLPNQPIETEIKPTGKLPQKSSSIWAYYTDWSIDIILSIALGILLIGYLIWQYQFNRFLVRKSADIAPDIRQFFVKGINTGLFSVINIRHDAQQLRKHVDIPVNLIDIEATIQKSIQSGGWFTPVTGSIKRLPEYLVLIDRTSFGDHQSHFTDVLVNNLITEGIYITRYYFDVAPRYFYPECVEESPISLAELTARYPEHRLLMFADGRSLLHPVTGQLVDWITQFETWPQRILLTIESPTQYCEKLLKQSSFIILPADEAGLAALAEYINSHNVPVRHNKWDFSRFPLFLSERPRRWIESHVPEKARFEELLRQVRDFLGKPGYYWLSACAVYPELHWELTLFLGHQLKVFSEDTVVKLARLPWFRYGTMPNWLREKLVADLSAVEEQQIREALGWLLVTALDKPIQSFHLEVASQGKPRLLALAKRLLPWWGKRIRKAHDFVFLSFTSNRLAVKVPKVVQSLLVRPMGVVGVVMGLIVVIIVGRLLFYLAYTTPTLKVGETFKDCPKCPEMVVIPAGKFMMGSNDGYDNEKPVHEVAVGSFAMGKYEVTIGEFKVFVESTGYKTEAEEAGGCHSWTEKIGWDKKPEFNWKNLGFTQTDMHPVACVSWNDAVAYAEWLSKKTGKQYRLPTEAEWEYAARAKTTTTYFWGNEAESACYYANVADMMAKKKFNLSNVNCTDGYTYTAPVGSFKANNFRLQDMTGNVWEWTCSDYEKYGSGAEKTCSKNTNKNKSLRGSSWDPYTSDCRVAYRNVSSLPLSGDYDIGFRVLCVVFP